MKILGIHLGSLATVGILAACYQGRANAPADGSDGGDASGDAGSDGGSDESGDDPSGACAPAALDMRRLTETQYRRAIEAIFAGHVAPSSQFPAPSGEPPTGYSTELGTEEVGEHDVERIVYAAEDVAEGVANALVELLPCAADEAAADACVGQFLEVYGRRAYRRPLTDDERAQLLDTWQAAGAEGATFAEAVALMVVEMLQTPQFLYAVEYAAPAARPLEGFEIASRLSFLLWDSIPDDELLDLADAGELADRDAVIAQAERMLASPNADTTIARLFREWTQTKPISAADKSAELFPFFDTDLASAMNESFDRFTVGTLRDGGSLQDMMRSTDAWVDPIMAEFLAVPAPADGEWTRASLDPDIYRGMWTQPALLASLAHSDRTSYVYRGVFVYERVLCQSLGPPPPGAMGTQLDLPPDPTARQESEARIAQPTCGSCHSLIDAPGLALEPFDAVGRYSPTDALGRTIDPSGTLVGLGIAFADHVDMIDQLAATPEVEACFARQLFRFSMSRMETEADECTIAAIEAVLADTDGDLGAALVAIVGTDAYRQREAP